MSNSALRVKFYLGSKLNAAKTRDAGRPVHDDCERIEIKVPGSRDTVDRPVRESDCMQHAALYKAFKAGLEAPVSGTSLEEWPQCTRANVETLRGVGCRTVEQLVAMSDHYIDSLGAEYQGLQYRAKDYLAKAATDAPLAQLRSENEALKVELQALKQSISEQTAVIDKLKADSSTASKPPQGQPVQQHRR